MSTPIVDKPDVDITCSKLQARSVANWLASKVDRPERPAAYFIFTQNVKDWSWEHVCHIRLTRIDEVKKGDVVVLGYTFSPQDTSMALTYFEWIVSRISPWRSLFSGGKAKALYKDGIPYGVQILECSKESYSLVRNLAITLRMAKEKPHKINAWFDLVREGLEPAEALFLSTFIARYDGKTTLMSGEKSAAHWMISYNKFVPELFFKSSPRQTTEGVNDVWGEEISYARADAGYISDLLRDLSDDQKLVRGTFGPERIFEDGVVLRVYKKWKKKNAIESVRRRQIKIY